ncbi:deaminase [Mesorhizobium sp. B2-8-9]|uniref:deoxycytidylate deaminase n=1 Tax=Mesorhizobium sp. B2-8-9 TaxID=2589899 RepID=UPI00112B16A5|nr:deaminase [Mesorhizobium sp. B2-8-9]TPI86396.1 hypothetical protein FJ423_00815 [Mesorhizobium sp. B2-8-9]
MGLSDGQAWDAEFGWTNDRQEARKEQQEGRKQRGAPKSGWTRYLLDFACHAATKSKDTTKVGAVLVGPEGEVRLTSYNGPPRGVQDRPERFERPAKYLYASHAEANLVAFAAREGIRTKGCAVYQTHHPCAACCRTLIQAGISAVYYDASSALDPAKWGDEMEAAATMFREAGIVCEGIAEPQAPRERQSITEQVQRVALDGLWEMLGAKNQTEAVIALRSLLNRDQRFNREER